MKIRSCILLFLIILILLIPTVYANDNESISYEYSDKSSDLLSVSDDLSFDDLNNNITNTKEGEILTLNKNYTIHSDDQYLKGIAITKSITIDGAGYTIDAKNSARIFSISASNVILKNIIFKNANTSDNYGGGAVFIAQTSSNVIFENSTFINNIHSKNGGAIFWQGDYGIISSCNFINNSAEDNGGSVYWYNNNGLINNTNFKLNIAYDGGAIYWDTNRFADSNCRIINSSFTNNKALNDGGAIYWSSSNALINKSRFENNSASQNAGAVMWMNPDGNIEESQFINNNASNGGALYIQSPAENTEVSSSLFINNHADFSGNAVLWLASAGNIYDSILISTRSGEILQTSGNGNNLIADYNWWGNTADDYKTNTKVSGIILNNWLFLNITRNSDVALNEEVNLTVKISNLYDKNTIMDYNANLPAVNMNLSQVNGTLSKNNIEVLKGLATVTFTPNNETSMVKVSFLNIQSNITIKTKLKAVFNVSIDDVDYPGNATALIKSDVDGEYILAVNNKNYTVNVEGGVSQITIDRLPADVYHAVIIFKGDSTYLSSQNQTDFTVNKGSNSLNVTINNVEYLKNATAEVSASIDGNYTVEVNGKTYNITVLNGFGKVTLDVLPVDNYTAVLRFINTNYSNTTNTTKFSVSKASNFLKVTIDNTEYPNNATAHINASADGNYTLKVALKTYTFKVENGEATVYLDVLAVGENYEATLTFINTNYKTTQNTTTFSVLKSKNTLNITINNVEYPLKGVAEVKASVDGDYKLLVNNHTYDVSVKNKTGKVTLNLLNAGEYTAKVYFNNTNYTSHENNTKFSVVKGDNTLNVTISDVELYTNPVAQIYASVNGKYTLEVNGKTYNITVADNFASTKIDTLPINKYEAVLKFSDGNYSNLKNKTTFNVTKLNNNLKVSIADTVYLKNIVANIEASVNGNYTLEVNNKKYNITVSDNKANITLDSLYVGQYSALLKFVNENVSKTENITQFSITPAFNTLNISVDDTAYLSNGIAVVKASIDGLYYVEVNGVNYTVNVVDGEGSTKIKVLNVNTYTAKVIFTDKNYTNLSNQTTFKVTEANNTLSVEIPDVPYKVNATAYVRASVDGEYIISVNGTNYTVNVLNGSGNTTIKALLKGQYNATVIFENANYAQHKNMTAFNVTKASYNVSLEVLDVYYPDLAVVKVNGSVDGEYLLKINDKNYTVDVVNGSGVKVLDLLDVDTYSINVTYTDSENYNEFTNTTTFSVLKGNNTLSINIPNVDFITPATAYVRASVDGNYSIHVNNKVYNVVVKNNTGKVTFERFNLGVYEAVLRFENENYTIRENRTTFKIAQYFNRLSMEIDNVTYPGNVTIFISVNIEGDYNLSVGGKTYHINIEKTTANITIANLAAGNYTAVLTLLNADTFTSPTNTTAFTVYKYDNSLKVSFSDEVYPSNVTAYVSGDIDGVYTLTVEGVDYNVNVVDGVGNVTLNVLNAGKHNATLKISDTQNYTFTTNTSEFYINKIKNQLNITVSDIAFGQNATLYITSSEKGNYTLSVNGVDLTVIYVNNTANYTLTNLGSGNYTVNITYYDTVNYQTPMNFTTFKVGKITNTLSIRIDNVTYPDKIIAYVMASEDGLYYVNIGDVSYPVTVTGKSGNVTLQIPAGDHEAVLSYFDMQNYTNPTNTTRFSVSKGTVIFNVTSQDIEYGEKVTVNINSNTDGFYAVSIIGTNYLENAHVVNGSGKVEFDSLPFGEYTAYVMFISNNNYNIIDNSTTFKVIRANVSMNVTFEDNCHGKDLIIKAESNADGNYTVTVNNKNYNLLVNNGKGNVSIANLVIGNYTVSVKSDVNGFYNSFEGSYNVTITKSSAYSFGVITPVAVYGGNAIVTITLPGDANGYISINGKYNTTIDGSCIIEIPDLSIGNHSVTIYYSGNENYTAGTKEDVITVISSIDANSTTKAYNSEYDLKIALLTCDNGPLHNTKVILAIDGVNISETTDEQGIITLSKLAIGNHTIVIHNPNTNESSTVYANILSRFLKYGDKILNYYSTTKYSVQVCDDNGSALGGVQVQFIINGKTKTVTSDNNGYASMYIRELPGIYTIIASYNGESVSSTVTIKQTLKPYKKTVTVKKTASKLILRAVLKKYAGKGISGKKIIFKFKGKKYSAVTNSKGIAKVTVKKSVIKKLKAGKKYSVTFTYVKNTVKGYVKVKK